ncbi:MAG: glycosyltransferase family 4 protein [Candidatus Methanoperedens sp.]|nr:glycosyltransferase family 4 protein [Candidatus Methanoperedens sp.]
MTCTALNMKVLFVYYNLHPSHKGFAESIKADLWYYNHYFNNKKYPRIFKSAMNGILLPDYPVYICEGGAPLTPVAIKKITNNKSINIELIADETFFMLKETPKEMKSTFTDFVNRTHRIASKYIDGALAGSALTRETAKEFLDVPIRIVYPYIMDDRYERLGKITRSCEGHTILSIGNGDIKGMDILIEAFKIVKEEIDDVELYIVGKGFPKKWNEIKGVHFTGYFDDPTQFFENASLYVQSSRADSFSVATLESLRAGLPTIVTEGVGAKEIVEKLDRNFVRKIDAEDIAKGIVYYFDLSHQTKKELSIKARKESEKFNRVKMCNKFRNEFNLLMEDITGNQTHSV